jgi:hypothetical protein
MATAQGEHPPSRDYRRWMGANALLATTRDPTESRARFDRALTAAFASNNYYTDW